MVSRLKKSTKSVLRGYSIQRRIPLLICIFLVCVMTAFTIISYLAVKTSALNTGKQRLLSLSNQLGNMLAQSNRSIVASTRIVARDPAVRKCVQSGGLIVSDEVGSAIRKLRQDSASILIELINTEGKPLVQWGIDSIQYKVNFRSLLHGEPSDLGTFTTGKIYRVRDSMYYPTILPVPDTTNNNIGYLVRWRLLTTTPAAIEQLSQLLGANATLYIGNSDGSLWTNLLQPVALPLPGNMAPGVVSSYRTLNGESVIGAIQPIEQSPWLVVIQLTNSRVTETAHRFLVTIIILGLAVIVIAITIAWLMSRRLTKPLDTLTKAAETIAAGDYSATVEVTRLDEVGKLAIAFNTMVREVNAARQELEERVKESDKMNTQLRDLSAHLQNIREEERIHIAREMHDELGQLLTGFKMDAAWLQKRWDTGTNPALVTERLAAMSAAIDEAVKFVRKLAAELRPSLLDDLGLIAALDWHSKEFEKRYHIRVDFHCPFSELEVPPQLATGLFRMYQESLTNVARHAQATVVVATLTLKEEQLCLSIMDNGKGFETRNAVQTLGLLGMRERAAMVGGNLEITSTPGKGTHVFIIIPLTQFLTVRPIP